jgi:alkanesulfonate monooxygenase SsuD/methylene tetrahydromethanopterin reductase-like flavin-dependent oxidoreductase (luciferase family)
MRLGATLVHLSDAPPFPVADWAGRLVAAGFESLWTPYILGRGSLIPDPFVTLAAAAVATAGSGVELGTATVQVPLYHPADLAFRVLSLMPVCDGRLTLGVSPGSTGTDFATLDRDYATRFATFRRNVARLRVLLEDGRDEHAVLAPPPPGGRPAMLLGSWGANVERAARDFEGWLASGYRRSPDQIIEAHDRFRAAGGQRAIVCAIPLNSPADLGPVGEDLRRYEQAGFDDAVVLIGPGGPDPEEVRALLPRGDVTAGAPSGN